MSPVERHAAKSYFRADYILVATTICVCALVAFLLLALATENNLHRQTLRTIFEARGARDAALALTQSLASADAARRAALVGGDRAAQVTYGEAKRQAREQTAILDGVGATDAQVREAAMRARRLTEQYLAELDSVTADQLRSSHIDPTAATRTDLIAAVDGLRELVNSRNDAAREREDRVRLYIDAIAAVLAIVAFIAPVLAILAVRRERESWRRVNAMAEEARAQAAQADLAKSRFLAVASHDMRQPLHALSLYISALQRRVETDEARDILTKMDRATQSLVGMFAKLLDLARVQAGVVKPEIGPVQLQDVLDRVMAEQPERAVACAPTDAIVSTDAVLLERLLGNLVSNALKHGGSKARIETTALGDDIQITVADDGPGIAIEDQQRIFEEFVRLEGRTEGLGLGLAIVKRISVLLDSPLSVQSSPGAGARFGVRLKRAPHAAAHAPASPESNALTGQAVLVIDDDEFAREAAVRTFTDLGADVRAGAREADAEQLLRDGFAPRLILMDLRIDSDIAGIAIAHRLQARLTPPPRVIVVTGDTGPETLAMLRQSGFAWLIKPVSPRDLRQAAAEQLNA